ncbi:MAG: hypothetical protein LBC64_01105 [Fibromonadaceae bacterium]|jgi:hypothetical protein|nr:hypothetical protein [Fibromonadaceae bacterium]
MGNKFSKLVLTATLGLAMAFTASCSGDDGDDNTPGSSSPSGGGGSSSSGVGGSSPDTFYGIWISSDGETMTLNNGNFELSRGIKGTYTAAASNITFNVKELSGNFLNQQDFGAVPITFENSKWYTKDQVIDAFRNFAKGASPWTDDEITSWLNSLSGDFNNMFPTRIGIIDGNTITVEVILGEPTTYTKTGESSSNTLACKYVYTFSEPINGKSSGEFCWELSERLRPGSTEIFRPINEVKQEVITICAGKPGGVFYDSCPSGQVLKCFTGDNDFNHTGYFYGNDFNGVSCEEVVEKM